MSHAIEQHEIISTQIDGNDVNALLAKLSSFKGTSTYDTGTSTSSNGVINATAVEANDDDETSSEVNTKLSISQFITDFGDGLIDAVRTQNPPVFCGEHAGRAAVLAGLKRQPFAAQARAVQAVTQLLLDQHERAAIINGEMGTGKTLMGIATAVLLHEAGLKRTLILAPPHLVYKWRREILDTVVNAQVVVLNGSDTLKKLQALSLQAESTPDHPTFYIMGRVRLRMGHHWRVAVETRRFLGTLSCNTEQEDQQSTYIRVGTEMVSCACCGAFVKDAGGRLITLENSGYLSDKKHGCWQCQSPLWTLIHPTEPRSVRELVQQGLCQLPGIGVKMADRLIAQFGEDLLARSLGDNVHQLVQLMDAEGNFVFSDKQAARLERALGRCEVSIGQAGYQPSEYIKRYLPKGFFSLLIVDEGHEYKNVSSAQGQAMGVLASQVEKIVLLTGTLMGGYADDLFYLLWRILPKRMIEDGYRYSKRGSLCTAAMGFLKLHGILKEVYKITENGNHRTARGKRESVNTRKAPGFGPLGVAHYLLPYTAFVKLRDMDQQVLPAYREHFVNVSMTEEQAVCYQYMEIALTQALKAALVRGDHTLLGVVLNALLAWPDCCFREEIVVHPRTKHVLAKNQAILGDEPSPKEEELIALCLQAKRAGRRTLVYTIYTGTRDTTARLRSLLEQADLNVAVLRSTTKADQREEWIAEQVERGIDVLICHPELVKTGLDLLAFPSIVFLQSGYNVYTLMQATRRSWRIGQKQDVDVYFLGYEKTAQIQCLSLMAKKIAVSQSTSGTMPDTGLDILDQDTESVEVALAKQLIGS